MPNASWMLELPADCPVRDDAAQPDGQEAEQQTARRIGERGQILVCPQQIRRFVAVCRKRGVCAQESGRDEQPGRGPCPWTITDQRQIETKNETARAIDQEGTE